MPRHGSIGVFNALLRKIHVQRRTRRLALPHPGGVIDMGQVRSIIQPAGAVAQHNGRAAPLQQLDERTQQLRVRGGGFLRLHRGDEVDLNDDAHPGADPIQPPQRCKHLLHCAAALRRVIAPAGDDADIRLHGDPS